MTGDGIECFFEIQEAKIDTSPVDAPTGSSLIVSILKVNLM